MVRYKFFNPAKGKTLGGKTSKPMQGAKKYSLIPLPCSKKECEAEFFVLYPGGKRYCEDHMPYLDSKASHDSQILAALGL